jgi:hypothetical protein
MSRPLCRQIRWMGDLKNLLLIATAAGAELLEKWDELSA